MLPEDAAGISKVPAKAKELAIVSVTALLVAAPNTTLEPEPLTVQAASVLTVLNMLYDTPAVVKSFGVDPAERLELPVQLAVDANEPVPL